ncbi:PA2778 family cysteine peptidase [Aquabacterium sp. A7-Y]|uniref:PA2778 family cysteine peptidase n=1 Tax=Aquabacterium sp. A7-Y TaxID=1349605 RepID=UPI00223DFD8B|nr:PA2778 family cysteine peptidase [Aquabacterium sp. A7-Y]MCW7537623.1 PA2778 family cysteine peptidase [Aquabacterium sp. A7-Y]
MLSSTRAGLEVAGPESRRRLLAGAGAWAALGLAGCAATQTSLLLGRDGAAGLPRRVELENTPFFPQDQRYLCGPESLAAVLGAAGIPATPAELQPLVYLPGREGSLQIEMLAAARRLGALAVQLPPQLGALCRELAAGSPVVILQNLGLAVAPTWHYAVVVGYDLDAGSVLLRSGHERRLAMRMHTFEHTWARSQHWAFVALPPGRLPASAGEAELTRALLAFERVGQPAAAAVAYQTAVERWPHNLTLQMGRGNTLYAAGRKVEASAVFEAVGRAHRHAAAWINHGNVELELGRRDRAREAARQALALGGPFLPQAKALQEKVEAAGATR